MRSPFIVREYDRIICKKGDSNDQNIKNEYKPLDEPFFSSLEEFIHAFSGNEENSDVLDFLKIGFKRNVGDIISINNYVGLIQMQNGFQIQILPKIDFADGIADDKDQKTKQIFLKMLRSLRDFPNKVFNEANLDIGRMNLYEIFINMYLQEVRALLKRGLKSTYKSQEENTRFYKGKLVVSEHIRHNAAHGERFYMRYDGYLIDRPENRLIKSTLLKLHGISSNERNQREIRQLLTSFELVKPSVNHQKELSRVTIDRSTTDYKTLMIWSKVFLLNKSFTTFSGDTNARALLFPMEKVFESYVALQLKKKVRGLQCKVNIQDKRYCLFDTPERFELRPDIVITKDDGSKVILDTKWKKLIDRPSYNYGISQADMYQMYAYAKKYNTPDVWLIYPMNEEMREHQDEISFKSNENVNVRIYCISIDNMEYSIEELCKKMGLWTHPIS